MGGKPITTFLITALILWAVYLWRHGRLGQTQMVPGVKRPDNPTGNPQGTLQSTPVGPAGPGFIGPPPPGGWQR